MIKEIILDILEAFILLGVFSSLTNQKKFIINNKVRTGLFCIMYVVATCFSTFYVNKVYHTLFIIVISILLLRVITKINFYFSIIIFSLFLTIIFSTETLVQFIEMFIFGVDLT